MKTEIKSHGNEVTDFYNNKIPKLGSNHTCLAVITLDSSLKKDNSYNPQSYYQKIVDRLKKSSWAYSW